MGENVTRKCAVSSGRCWGRRCRPSHRPGRPWAPGRKTRGSSPGEPRCCCKDPGVTDLSLTCRTTIIYQSTKLSSWGRGSPINPPRNKKFNDVENLLYNSCYKICLFRLYKNYEIQATQKIQTISVITIFDSISLVLTWFFVRKVGKTWTFILYIRTRYNIVGT